MSPATRPVPPEIQTIVDSLGMGVYSSTGFELTGMVCAATGGNFYGEYFGDQPAWDALRVGWRMKHGVTEITWVEGRCVNGEKLSDWQFLGGCTQLSGDELLSVIRRKIEEAKRDVA